ncbi:putative membrane protein (plasmid) [Caballeronia cordobensis]|nr:putative membrane protein [Burkholderia sp. RPE67]
MVRREILHRKERRAAVLFGTERPLDEWFKDENVCHKCGLTRSQGLGFGFQRGPEHWTQAYRDAFESGRCDHDPRPTFNVVPSVFLKFAEQNRPKEPDATASGFAQWLYSLYGTGYGKEEDRERGKQVEPIIFERRRNMGGQVDNGFLRSIRSDWRLRYNGLHLPNRDQVQYLAIDHLRVNGEALRVSPDLIYQNERTNEGLIVELKYTRMRIPRNLWPNVWGQLWCYAQTDLAKGMDHLRVVGEVWAEKTEWYGRRNNRATIETLSLRETVRRDPRAPAFDRFFSALFDIYASGGRRGHLLRR